MREYLIIVFIFIFLIQNRDFSLKLSKLKKLHINIHSIKHAQGICNKWPGNI